MPSAPKADTTMYHSFEEPETEELPEFQFGDTIDLDDRQLELSDESLGVDERGSLVEKQRTTAVSSAPLDVTEDLTGLSNGYWDEDHPSSAPLASRDGPNMDTADISSFSLQENLETMEFSTKLAAPVAGQASRDAQRARGGLLAQEPETADAETAARQHDVGDETTGDSFLDYANGVNGAQSRYSQRQRAMQSFLSDSQQQQQQQHRDSGRMLPRRPESYHDFAYDGPSASEEVGRLPTFESPADTGRSEESSKRRLAQLVARYAGNNPRAGSTASINMYESSEAVTDGLPEIADTPEVNTAFTSGQYSVVSDSPASSSIPVSGGTPRDAARAIDPSIVERTKNALQQRMASIDNAEQPEANASNKNDNSNDNRDDFAGNQRYTELRQRFLAGSGANANANQRPMPAVGGSAGGSMGRNAGFAHLSAYSLQNASAESLEHPNMGSQGTHSPDRSILSMMDGKDMQDFYSGAQSSRLMDADQFNPFDNVDDGDGDDDDDDDDVRFGANMINSFGDSTNENGHRSSAPFETYRDNRETFGRLDTFDENEMFTPVDDADEVFGDRANSSNQAWSDIVRDHEEVFSDLMDSLDSEIPDDLDPNGPPESLFASSSSIVAEISRRRAAGGFPRTRKFSTWDGREATQDAMRVQEERFSAGGPNPIEMLDKANSLGMSDNETEISGVLPESEYSPLAARPAGLRPPEQARKPTFRGRSNTGLTLGISGNRGMQQNNLAGYPAGPQTAPMNGGYGHRHAGNGGGEDQHVSRDAPPPTTPTTFISRDTRHGPSTRVLHQVPPFDLKDLPYPDNAAFRANGEASAPPIQQQKSLLGFSRSKKPNGPRAIDNSRRAPPPLSIRQNASDRQNLQAAADFALAASSNGANNYASDVDDDDTHGLGSLLQDTLSMSDVSRISRTPNSQFQALNRILGTPRGPQQAASPLRGRARGSSRSSVLESTKTSYMPFQEPTVDISRLPHYRSIGLLDTDGAGGREQGDARASAQVDGHMAGAGPAGGKQGEGGVALVSERELFNRMAGDDTEDDMVGTVRYDSPTPSGGSLASLSMSDIGMDSFTEKIPQRPRRRGSSAAGTHSAAKPRPSRGNSQSQGGGEAGGPTLRDIYDLLKKTVSNLDSQSHSRAHSQSHANGVLEGLQEMAEAMSRDRENSRGSMLSSRQQQQQQQQQGEPFGNTFRSQLTSATNQASSIGEHVPRLLRTGYAADETYGFAGDQEMSTGGGRDLTADADQSYPALRPSAPTPRRGQIFSRFVSNLDESAVEDESRAGAENPEIQRIRSDAGHSRVRQHLQRYVSDTVVDSYNPAPLSSQPAAQPPRFDLSSAAMDGGRRVQEQAASGVEERVGDLPLPPPRGPAEALEDLVRMLGLGEGLKKDRIPAPLAEKLLELVATVAKASSSGSGAPVSASAAVQTENGAGDGQLRSELLRLQKDILAKFDECRAEVDTLRAEVRQGSAAASLASAGQKQGLQKQGQGDQGDQGSGGAQAALLDTSVNPLDSVSMVGGRQTTPSPRRESASDVRPLFVMPTTARNQRRHMVQWLSNQDVPQYQPGSPLAQRGQRTTDPGFGSGALSAPASGRRPNSAYRRRHAAGSDADDDRGYMPETAVAGDGFGKGGDGQEEDDVLSDTSTTVPDYVPRMAAARSPVDPAMINPANIPSRRQQQKMRGRAAGAWADVDKDLLGARETLDSLRQRSGKRDVDVFDEDDGFGDAVYSQGMARQLADTLAELQRVHGSHFHRLGTKSEAIRCPVCASLEAQNQDPYLFGKHAVAYKSMSTRQLQGLLNAYVAAMEDEFSTRSSSWGSRKRASGRLADDVDVLGPLKMDKSQPAYHSFTPTRLGKRHGQMKHQRLQRKPGAASPPKAELDSAADAQATRVVIELLREELDALSRRYHRMVEEYQRLNPSNASDQRRRRHMARELKDLVDLLDVKGEQIAVLAGLHQPSKTTEPVAGKRSGARGSSPGRLRRRAFWDAGFENGDDSGGGSAGFYADDKPASLSSAERAYRSARELQQALGDLY